MLQKKVNILCFLVIASQVNFLSAFSQEEIKTVDPIKRYDEIIDINTLEANPVQEVVPKDELALFLPDLKSPIYKGWAEEGNVIIWEKDRSGDFVPLPLELLNELNAEKVLKQTYKKEDYLVDIFVYRFKDYLGAYSAFTLLREGKPSKLRVGRESYESERSISFWKDRYLVDMKSRQDVSGEVKSFIILSTQEVSSKLKGDHIQPQVAIQLPALNRIHGTEKYCIGEACFRIVFPPESLEFDPENLNISKSEGAIRAEYKVSDNQANNERLICLLLRYQDAFVASSTFDFLSKFYLSKQEQNKELKVDEDDGVIRIKKDKNLYTFLKQKGNMLGILFQVPDKKTGEKFMDLIPWPVEVKRPARY